MGYSYDYCNNYGYAAPIGYGTGAGFTLIVVLFILLVIVGAVCYF